MCHDCSSCPEGRVIQECNATMDTVCDSKQGLSGHSPELWVILVSIAAAIATVAIAAAGVIAFIRYSRHKKDRRALNDVNDTVSTSTML